MPFRTDSAIPGQLRATLDFPPLPQAIQRLRNGNARAESAAISRVNAVISFRLTPVPKRIRDGVQL